MTPYDATAEMYGNVIAATPPGVIIAWEDVPTNMPTTSWIRPSIRHITRGQSSLSNHNGKRMFTASGVLTIDCHALIGDGMKAVSQLSNVFVQSLEAIRGGGVWYRNIRALERGKDGAFTLVIVIADFEYSDTH